MRRLRKRSEYLEVARGARTPRRGFLLQSIQRGPDRTDVGPEPRFGFTVTKKIGNAVVRNRIRRRLKEAVRLNAGPVARPMTDYVLVGRRPALDLPFDELVADLIGALAAAGKPRDETRDRSRREQKRPNDG